MAAHAGSDGIDPHDWTAGTVGLVAASCLDAATNCAVGAARDVPAPPEGKNTVTSASAMQMALRQPSAAWLRRSDLQSCTCALLSLSAAPNVEGSRLTSEAQVRLMQANRRLQIGPGAAAMHCDADRRRNGVDKVMLDLLASGETRFAPFPRRLLARALGLV